MIESICEKDQSGSDCWYRKDDHLVLHRDNAPAIIWDDGSEFWYYNGLNHRDDGPAVIHHNGEMKWYCQGVCFSFPSWCKVMNKTSEDVLYLKLKYKIS